MNREAIEAMLERVAREICAAKGYDPDAPAGEHLVQWQTFRELARSTIAARPSQPADVERVAAIETLRNWLERQPVYAGDDPRAEHYRHNRRTLELAIAAIQSGDTE